MKSTGREGIIFTVISFFVLLATVFSFTYAFFSANTLAGNFLNTSASINEAIVPIFTAHVDGDLVLNVGDNDMTEITANNSTTSLTANETINVSLLGGSSTQQAVCTFNFKWIDTSATPYQASLNRGSLKEYTLKIVEGSSSTVFAETNIDSLVSGANLLNNNLTITSNGVLVSVDYNVIISFYNLNTVQNLEGKKYSSKVVVSDVVC